MISLIQLICILINISNVVAQPYYCDCAACSKGSNVNGCAAGKHSVCWTWGSAAVYGACWDCDANYYCPGNGIKYACPAGKSSPPLSTSIASCVFPPTPKPTINPSPLPSLPPTRSPSPAPTARPTQLPTLLPSPSPSYEPSIKPSAPTSQPSSDPSQPTS